MPSRTADFAVTPPGTRYDPAMTFRVCFCASLAAAVISGAAPGIRAEEPFSLATTPGKLPKDIVPRAYVVHVSPDPISRACSGSETIDLEVLQPASRIVLNAADLEITSASIQAADSGAAVSPLQPQPDAAEQTVTFALPKELPAGKYRLALAFNYHLHDLPQGLYLEHYDAPSGKKTMLASQMEPTDARRMFPCWDEPVFRATFQLNVSLPLPACEKFEAVSNMPVAQVHSTMAGGGLTGTREFVFAPTPPMASYLVALVAGELEQVKGEADGVQIRVLTTEGKRDSARYALESAEKILSFYNDYFGIHYPLPKLDEIALPGGFGGAMENWGAITYNESILLYDPQTSSVSVRESVFAVMAHEMAHQWFGDLVTMAWWDNLWLNEGFASWMGTKTTDHFNPEWHVWLRANARKETAMSDDERRTTHPIQQPVKTEQQAMSAFDSITYLKGQSFLRMLENYLGPDVFRDGIRRYMAAHKYSSTITADLWAALSAASGKPVAQFAQGWTTQPGFPVVELAGGADHPFTLTQHRFTVRDPGAAPLVWQVPVAIEDVAKPGKSAVVLIPDAKPVPVPPEWNQAGALKLNAGDVGFYRSEYSPEHFDQLLALSGQLSEADRLNLLGDTWASMFAGRQSATRYLDLLNSLRADSSPAFLEQAIGRLRDLRLLLLGTPGYPALCEYARGFLGPQLVRLGWDAKPAEPATDTELRGELIEALADYGDAGVTAEATRRFDAFLKDPASLPGSLRASVFHAVGIHASKEQFDELHALAVASTRTEDKYRYYGALGAVADPALLPKALAILLTDEAPMPVLMRSLLPPAFESQHPDIAWTYMKAHARETLARVAAFSGARLFSSYAGAFSSEGRADEFAAFAAGIPQLAKSAEVARDIEGIRIRADVKGRELAKIDQWMTAHVPADGSDAVSVGPPPK
jgi:aminopeptidase N